MVKQSQDQSIRRRASHGLVQTKHTAGQSVGYLRRLTQHLIRSDDKTLIIHSYQARLCNVYQFV